VTGSGERRVVLVTGAGAGIGRVLAQRYASDGFDVVLAGRQHGTLDETAALLGGGAGALVRVADIRREDDLSGLVEDALAWRGRIDVLLNNAAVPGTDEPVTGMTLENWNDTLATDVTGPMLLSREVLNRAMVPAERGNIQFFSSAAAKAVLPNKGHYAVAKHGLIQLGQTLAMEVGPFGIRVNTLVIGTVRGELVERWIERRAAAGEGTIDELLGQLTAPAALRRLVEPEEVAAVSLWLASDQASAITGQDINVTAGAEKR
jgi:3-hydroxybutyrate dehydrogenase